MGFIAVLVMPGMTTLTPIHREVVNLVSYQGKKVEDVAQPPRGAGLYHQDALALCQRPHGQAVRRSGHPSRVDGALVSATPQKMFRNYRVKTGAKKGRGR